uniref:Occludin a n=1 Tax=Sinocyclocheilus rhinocerous TaxID=307959 RepID=A0A673LMK6_9TELE
YSPAYSYYPDEEFQHFYRWTSPPGIIKIMCVMSVIFCVGIFVCVASTLAWDTDAGAAGFGGYGGSYGGYGYGILGSQNDPRQGKGFMIAMAIITFIVLLVIFIMIISHQKVAQGRKFYLAVIIVSAIMAFLMLVATIVYLVTVYPMAQSSGSVQFNQVYAMCAAYQQPQMTGGFVNQYLYHYCVVDPQEAIALVLGFIVTAALIIIMVFAIKTRQRINNHGKDNILWRRVKEMNDQNSPQDVEDWVSMILLFFALLAEVQSNQNVFRHLQHFSHYHSLFGSLMLIQEHVKMVIKYDKNSRVKLCPNKFILIMSDNFDRKVCNKTWSGQSVKSDF